MYNKEQTNKELEMIETGQKKLEMSELSGFHKKRMTIDVDYMSAFNKLH